MTRTPDFPPSTPQLRIYAERIIRARRLLLLGVVHRSREDFRALWETEGRFQVVLRLLPLYLQREAAVEKYITGPAHYILERKGVLTLNLERHMWNMEDS